MKVADMPAIPLLPPDISFLVSRLRKIADGLESGHLILESATEHAGTEDATREGDEWACCEYTGQRSLALAYHSSGPEPLN